MDAFVRRRRRVLRALAGLAGGISLLAVAGLSACGVEGAAGRGAIGASDKPRSVVGVSPGLDAGARDGAASLPTGYRETFSKVNRTRVTSQGHATGRWDVDVYANEAGAQALATRAREAPTGATVVVEHYERAARERPGPVYVMEKRERGFSPDHGDWRYVVVGSRGQLVNDGVIASCAGCHDGAPMDGLFPILE